MNPIKKYLLAFLVGVVLTSSIWIALLNIRMDDKIWDEDASELLDYIINEWTGFQNGSDQFRAQLSARIEVPDARPGFIPDTVKILAQYVQSVYKIPKGVVIAQWILESSWGRNNLSVSNYFGHTWRAVVRYSSRKDLGYVMRPEKIPATIKGLATGKDVAFASYKNIAECFDTHGRYLSLSKIYRNARSAKSPEAFARELYKAGYATDPDYALKLITIMRRYKL